MSAVWYILSFVLIFVSLMIYKKSEKVQNGLVWGVISVLTILCYQTFIAGVINLVNIPINAWSIGAFNYLMSVILLIKIKGKEKQKYFVRKIDILAFVVMLVITIAGAYNQFGLDMSFTYASVDASTHFTIALKVLKNQEIEGLFFSSLNNALFLNLFTPFVKATNLYKAFILSDILMYFVGGVSFYCVIANKVNNRAKGFFAILFSALYMLGYPRNNLLFGFNYLGMSIALILYLVFILEGFISKTIKTRFSLILLSLGCYAVGVCYSLFVPVVYVSVCAAISVDILFSGKDNKNKLEKLKSFIVTNLQIFLIPTVLVIIYSLIGYFGPAGSNESISMGISREGGVYRDLFSNFIFWVPFAIYGAYRLIKSKVNNLAVFYAFFLTCFILVMGVAGMKGYVSSYYYYKNYFFLSAVVFYLSFCGILYVLDKCREFVYITIGVFGILAIISFGGIETKIQNRNYLFCPAAKSQYFFDIYNSNYTIVKNQEKYSKEKMELYDFCYDNFSCQDYDKLIICSSLEDLNIVRAETQRIKEGDYIFWKYLSEQEKESLGLEENIDINAYVESFSFFEEYPEEIPFIIIDTSGELIAELKQCENINVDISYQNSEGAVGLIKM